MAKVSTYSAHAEYELGNFQLGTPALVCRWRLAGKRLPLANRHTRALSRRTIQDEPIPAALVAWVRQHMKWTLTRGAAQHPDGVLMLMVDESKHAAMMVGEYEPLPSVSARQLALRAQQAQSEAAHTGVAPEVLWLVQDDHLVCTVPAEQPLSGANDLVFQLATTIGIPTVRSTAALSTFEAEPVQAKHAQSQYAQSQEAFLVSDEHGVVLASDMQGVRGAKFARAYAALLEKERSA